MNDNKKNYRGLGRGLETLLNARKNVNPLTTSEKTDTADTQKTLSSSVQKLSVFHLHSGKFQPRQHFDNATLDSLANSIKSQGLVQPIVVKPSDNEQYEIIAGERRWRAAQKAGLTEVPVIVRNDLGDKESMAVALIENIQREDLNAIEEAEGLMRLNKEFKLTHEEIANIVGKSRAAVTNSLRLLDLQQEVQIMVREGILKMGHVRALLSLDREQQIEVANTVAEEHLTTRQVEAKVQKLLANNKEPEQNSSKKTAGNESIEVIQLQQQIADLWKQPVKIEIKANGTGDVKISYNNLSELKQTVIQWKTLITQSKNQVSH